MRTAFTIAYKGGKASILAGPEVSISQQLKDTAPMKAGEGFPDGVDAVEVWSSDEGVIRRAQNREVKPKVVPKNKA